MTPGLIAFDLDGTLIETSGEIADAVNDTLLALGYAPVSQRRVDDWIGHGTRTLLIAALADARQTTTQAVADAAGFAAIEAEFAAHYLRRCGTRSRLYPKVRETLEVLRQQGVRLAVVTNKESRYTQVVLDAHELTPLLDDVVSGDTFPVKKPDPRALIELMARHQVPANRTLFVGDSRIDVATARNAGIQVWALPYGYNMGEPIEDSQPDLVIPDVSVLLTHFFH
jgi:phosphoglycolate phosphatase